MISTNKIIELNICSKLYPTLSRREIKIRSYAESSVNYLVSRSLTSLLKNKPAFTLEISWKVAYNT